jgi:hypothetical protein
MANMEVDHRVKVALDSQARQMGLSLEGYLRLFVPPECFGADSILAAGEVSPLSPEESERQLEALLFTGPTLPPDFRRADIYDTHD